MTEGIMTIQGFNDTAISFEAFTVYLDELRDCGWEIRAVPTLAERPGVRDYIMSRNDYQRLIRWECLT